MTVGQIAALVLLTAASGLAVYTENAHYDRRDDAEAVHRVQVFRFGPRSRMRLSTYLKAQGLRDGATWTTERISLSVNHVHLALPDGRRATFAIDRDRVVTPVGAEAEALVAAVRAQPEQPMPPPSAAPSTR